MNALGQPDAVLLLGGTSDIGGAIVDRFVAGGTRRVVLAGRDVPAMQARAGALPDHVTSEVVAFDAVDTDTHGAVLDQVFAAGDIDVAVLAVGQLGDQQRAEDDPSHAVAVAQVNYVGGVSASLHVAAHIRRQGHGTLVVLSSVAGERVRRSNFVYGSTKAGLDGFAQGLDDSLTGRGGRVMIVRPGFVTTFMTAHLPAPPLSTTAEAVADAVVRGLERRTPVVWVPGILRVVMSVLRHLPRTVFRRLPL